MLQGAVESSRWLQRSLTGTQGSARQMRVMVACQAELASTIWASSKKTAPAHDHSTTLELSLTCERRTPWPASAAVETPRCTPPLRLFLPTAPRALPTTTSAMAAGTLPDVHMAAVEGGTGQRLGHAVIIVAGVCSLMASLTTFV